MPFTIIEDKNSYESTESPFVSVDNGQFRGPELKEEWDYEYTPDDSFDADLFNEKQGELIGVTPSRFTEFAIMMPNKEKNIYEPFSFTERRYLRPIYDSPNKRVLLCCARQVEKTEVVDSIILLFNGAPIRAGDVKVGDYLATMSTDNSHMTYGRVSWVSKRYNKPCVNIKSRQGHSAKIATTHPMRVWDSWAEAGNIKVADKLAVVRRAGEFFPEFSNKPEYPKHRIRLTAYLIGDGSIGGSNKSGCIGFTQMCGPVLDEFLADIILSGGSYSINQAHKSIAYQVRVHRPGMLRGWMIEDGLMGHTSHTKFIPFWIWGLSREDTALFINRLWSTDGHVKQITKSRYALAYCSVSYQLIRELQSLLWKFGIPSNIRRNWPNYWKEKNIEKYAYILQIETQEGVTKFLRDIGALGKSKGVPLPSVNQNNNRDTYPIEINNLIRNIIKSKGNLGRYSGKSKSLRTLKLRETLKYPPTVDKIRRYVEFFKSDLRYDPVLVAELEKHIDTDLYWDEVEEIIDIGEQECVDFEVEGTHNFICDGFITHNSTLLGNRLLSYSCINTALNSLYVSPTNMQAKVFSQDRLAEPMATSNYLKSWTTTKLSDSVFLKKFINRSQITLRYAYLNADRCLAGDSLVLLTDGNLIDIRKLAQVGEPVNIITTDTDNVPHTALATRPRSTGIRPVIVVHTNYAVPLRCTPDHRIMTLRGWVEAQNLVSSDFISSVSNLNPTISSWVKVQYIETAPIHEEMFCLTVEGYERFIANGLVVSNCRGIPADIVALDEIQDILTDNIPVIEECASHSTLTIGGEVHRGGIFIYSGTPKSLDNTLEKYWSEQSTQNEWIVPCHRHSIQTPGGPVTKLYWNILTEDHIGSNSLVCEKCHKPIHPMDPEAKWASMNAKILKSATIKKPFEGFRISQLMVPWVKHNDILQKQATYSRDKFYNEVLGKSYDSGTRPLTRQDLMDNTDPRLLLTPEYQEYLLKFLGAAFPVYAGIDWSGGSGGSYTVLSLGAYMGDSRFTIFYVHRFEGKESEPQIQIEEISRIINKFRVQLVGCDYGGGFWPNDELTRRFGFQRIPKYQYAQISTKVMWQDGLKRFLVHRTEVMSDIFNAIKRRNIFRFPNWEQFQSPFGEDCLNIFSEYNEQIRQNVYKKSPNCTDDTFHSIVLCFLASMIRNPRPDIVAPTANAGRTPKPNR